MKVQLELVEGLPEAEVVIRCAKVDDVVLRLQQLVLEQQSASPRVAFSKDNQDFFFPLDDVLFFETQGEQVYAHTLNDAFRTKLRLYELEETLPHHFVRAAKAVIVNTKHIYSVTRNLAGASQVQFAGTHKQVYASRHYYGALRERLKERNNYEA